MYVGAVEEMVCVVCMLQRGHSGDLASTLCKYDLRMGDLFVLSWARVRRVRWKSLFRAANVLWRCVQYYVIAFCG